MAKSRSVYVSGYIKENIRQFPFKLNKQYDQEMIEFLEKQENRNEYIRRLIEEDMKKQNK